MQPSGLPFYMSYPLPFGYSEENRLISDMEYLQQMYPAEAKRYQRRIVPYVDRKDYTGSVIYDEYPDALSLYRMVKEIAREMEKDQKQKKYDETNPVEGYEDNNTEDINEEILQILLYYEILKRRHMNKSGRLWF